MSLVRRELALLLLLAAAPLVAYSPALREGRLLAPGDGAALHLPLRFEVWRAYAHGELPSWNPSSFSGTPLLASYRPGALHPLMLALALLPPPLAFQTLVLVSLALAGALCHLYARRLGAERPAALLAALGFALGPYLVLHLEDTATIVAAPALPLLLLAVEAQLARPRATTTLALAASVALLALAGSPPAAGAGALLLAARLALALLTPAAAAVAGASLPRRLAATAAAVLAGLLLAAPQLLPTLIAIREAGPAGETAGSLPGATLGGMAGVVVRSVSHTPTAVFVLAAVPLLPAAPGARRTAALAALALLAYLWKGRFESAGAVPLALDFALSVIAGLSLSVQLRLRGEERGRRLRLLALFAALCAAAALSVATSVSGPLDGRLAAPVGLLALGLILYFTLAGSRSAVAAHVFLLPLVVSALMQPWGRQVWAGAPTAAQLDQPTPTREAIDKALGPRRTEGMLVLAESPPAPQAAADLAWANLATFCGRRNVNGYDPLVPRSRRLALDGMRADGTLPRHLLETDPARLELLGVRWLQVPTASLVTTGDPEGLGDELDVVIDERRPHLFPLPFTPASEVRIVSYLAGATQAEQRRIVAECVVRLASGRELSLPIRAGVDTAEWAWERPDVRASVKHSLAEVYASFPTRDGFTGHQYRGVLRLPGRFLVAALRFRGTPGAPSFWLLRAGLYDAGSGRSVGVGIASAHVSDELRLAQAAFTPLVSLFEVRRGIAPAWVVSSLRRLPDEPRLLDVLRAPTRLGVDPRREALVSEAEAAGLELPPGSRSSAADLARSSRGRIVVRAAGPGLLVVAEGYDRGWRAWVDGREERPLRVNEDRIGVVLGEGNHRVLLRHRPRGLLAGAGLALAALLTLALAVLGERRRRGLTLVDRAC